MSEYKFYIGVDDVEKIRGWFKSRGGVLMWTNQEIGVTRPEQITPATHEDGTPGGPPHWAYRGESVSLQPNDIGVRVEFVVPLPVEWFPIC
jgi:hypothetical protein